jgi:hypothetical protein
LINFACSGFVINISPSISDDPDTDEGFHVFNVVSSGLQRCVALWAEINVSDVHANPIFRMKPDTLTYIL